MSTITTTGMSITTSTNTDTNTIIRMYTGIWRT